MAAWLGPAFQQFDSMENRGFAHTLMFGFNLAAFSSMLTFVAVKTPGRRGHLSSWAATWGPFVGLVLASLMVMFDLTRHVLLDADLFNEALHMFNRDGSLTPAGCIGMGLTWLGNALLAASLIWYLVPLKQTWCDSGIDQGVPYCRPDVCTMQDLRSP